MMFAVAILETHNFFDVHINALVTHVTYTISYLNGTLIRGNGITTLECLMHKS